jgi:F420-non-reducing hydrogenase iron-sulfur subunit
MSEPFEPKILAFLCNWCAYAGADLAGVSRFQYPPTIRAIRIMCSGRVDPGWVVNGLKSGFDSVFVSGWHIGECHYLDGNVYAAKRMEVVEDLLDISGIGRNRMQLRWVSAAEGQLFARYVTEFSDMTSEMGPFDLDRFGIPLAAVEQSLNSPRIRWLLGLTKQLTERENVYHEKLDEDDYKELLRKATREEYEKALIAVAIKESPCSVGEISEKIGLPVYTISLRLNELERYGLAQLSGYDGSTPKFIGQAP